MNGLSEELFVYALGRPMDGSDRDTIADIVAIASAEGQRMSSIIEKIASSAAYRTRPRDLRTVVSTTGS